MTEERFESRINELIAKLDRIEENSIKMSEHIDFVNSLYGRYQTGLDFVHSMFTQRTKKE